MDTSENPLRAFVLKPTTPEERQLLRDAGLVHITGLTAQRGNETFVIGERTPITQVGMWSTNNGKFVIITEGGEYWLGASQDCGQGPAGETRSRAIDKLAPRGIGCFVPCSNGENIRQSDLLERLFNPDWMPKPA